VADVMIRIEFNIFRQCLQLLSDKFNSFQSPEAKLTMLYAALVIINLLPILLPDNQQTTIGNVQEMIANSLSELTSQSTNAFVKVWEFFDDIDYHI
jgi:hypothetical protein